MGIPSGALSVVARQSGDGIRLAVTGEIDMATARTLDHALWAAIDQRPHSLVVDLDAVTFMASAGVTCLLTALRRARANGVTYVVTNCHGVVERVLQITGVYKTLTGGHA
jgi:anti-sigma B factor antagonist